MKINKKLYCDELKKIINNDIEYSIDNYLEDNLEDEIFNTLELKEYFLIQILSDISKKKYL